VTGVPGPDRIVAVAVPAATFPFTPVTVIVSTWFELTGFVAVAGVIAMNASTHFFSAFGSACPAAASFTAVPVVRVRPGWPSTEIADDACTTEVPVTSEVIVTVHELVAPPAA